MDGRSGLTVAKCGNYFEISERDNFHQASKTVQIRFYYNYFQIKIFHCLIYTIDRSNLNKMNSSFYCTKHFFYINVCYITYLDKTNNK